MNRSLIYLFTLTLLALAACSPAANPSPEPTPTTLALAIPAASSPTSAPTVVLPTPDWSRLLSSQLTSGDPSQADQAAQELTNWARDASGLRIELGAQADEIFRLADEAQSAAVQELLRKLQSGSKPKGMPAPLPPRLRRTVEPSDSAGILSLLTVLITSPIGMDPQTGGGNPITSSNETDQAVGENAHAHAKATATVTGSQMEVEVGMTLRVEQGGKVYQQHASGKIKFNVCPDPQGNVPLDITLQIKGDTSGGGYGLNLSSHVVGHVDDDANLASIDQDLSSEVSMTKGKNWLTGAPDTSFVQVNISYTMAGLASKAPGSITVSNPTLSVPRASWSVSKEMTENAVEMGGKIAAVAAVSVLKTAEDKWQDGKCVAIVVPEGEQQRVLANSDTPFTAKVRHKFENQELQVPVIATLKSGQVSVTPSGTKVPAPATFRYKAPDEGGREDATVGLVSRSRRGIGKLDVTFKTEDLYYNVQTAWFGSEIELVGSICSFDQPFSLRLGGHKPPNFPYEGKVEFTPKDATSGTWMATGTFSTSGGTTNDSGGSTYQVTGLAEGKPVIVLNEFTQKGVLTLPAAITRVIPAGPVVTTYHWPGTQIPVTQTTGNCLSG